MYVYISTDSVYDPSQATLDEKDPYLEFQESGIPEKMGWVRKEELTAD